MPQYIAGLGLAKIGAIGVKGVAVVHHALAAHALTTAAVGTGTLATMAYLDHAQMRRWFTENESGLTVAHTVKFAIGGKLVKGEFTTVAANEPVDTVLQGFMHESNKDVIKSRVIKAKRFESSLADALAGGNMLVYN